MIFTHLASMFDVTNSLYSSLFIAMLYWADRRTKSSERKAEKREERLIDKVEEMEKRYIEREDKYQEVVNILSIEIVNKVDNIVNDVEEIKNTIKENNIK